MTCYIPPFTEFNGTKQRAACGRWIEPREHATAPECQDCQLYLAAEADDDETARALENEYPEFAGRLVAR